MMSRFRGQIVLMLDICLIFVCNFMLFLPALYRFEIRLWNLVLHIGFLTVFDHNGYDYQYKVEAIFDDACGLCFNEVPLGGFWSYVSNDFDLGLQFEIIGNRWDNPELLKGEG